MLNSPVLVLNRHWQPVNICSARRAVTLLFMGHAQVVLTEGENNFSTHDIKSWVSSTSDRGGRDIIRSISVSIGLPEIIVLSLFDRLPKKEIKFTRQNVFERDEYTCQYCSTRFDSKDLNLDHVIPREKGGKNSWDNIVTSCVRCNTKKANKLPQQANMFPVKEPKVPRWRPFMCQAEKTARRRAYPSWRHFLDLTTARVEITD